MFISFTSPLPSSTNCSPSSLPAHRLHLLLLLESILQYSTTDGNATKSVQKKITKRSLSGKNKLLWGKSCEPKHIIHRLVLVDKNGSAEEIFPCPCTRSHRKNPPPTKRSLGGGLLPVKHCDGTGQSGLCRVTPLATVQGPIRLK